MILWIILAALVVALSFVLAAKSMKDFEEIPSEAEEYGLFLVKVPSALNKKLLDTLYADSLSLGLAVSFERLIKGEKGALVLFFPKSLMPKYQASLGLLEIEDYTEVDLNFVSGWEVGVNSQVEVGRGKNFFKKFPKLLEPEQFFWQIILLAKKTEAFQVQIRAVLISPDPLRRRKLTEILEERSYLSNLPKAASAQIVASYQKRSFTKETSNLLNTKDILRLLVI